MKVLSHFLFFQIFIGALLTTGLAEASTLEELQEAYKQYRELRKQGDKYMPISLASETQESTDVSICVSCPKIADLTGEINKVMRTMVESKQIDSEELGALEEIERLEAMYYIVHYDMEKVGQLLPGHPLEECLHYPLDIYLRSLDSEPLEGERLTEIFSFQVPLERVNALHYRSRTEKGRYYFYRAAYPHQDKIIRIHIPNKGHGEVTVSYYQLDQIPEVEKSVLMKKLERQRLAKQFKQDTQQENVEEEAKVFGMEYWGALGRYQSDSSQWQAGLAIAHKNNLPRRILILKGKDVSEIGAGLKLGTEVEVSDRDQEVRFRLAYQDQDLVRLKGEADGDYRAEVPFEISVQEYAFSSRGSIAQTESGQEAKISFYHNSSSIVHVQGKRGTDHSESVTIGNNFENVLGGTVSLDYKYNKNPNDEANPEQESIWLRYRSTF